MTETDYDEYDSWEDGEVKRGGGGGSKKKEHHGKKTSEAIKVEISERTKLKEDDRGEIDFEETVWRLIELDEDKAELKRLEEYISWLREEVIKGSSEVVDGVEGRCNFKSFKRSKGAGGQNVNKVSTAVRVEHLPTVLKLERYQERSLEGNKRDGLEAMQELVKEHVEEVQKMLGGSEDKLGGLRSALEMVVGNSGDHDWWNEGKRASLERIISVGLRER